MKILHPSRVYKDISFPSRLLVLDSNQLYEIPALPNLNSTIKPGQTLSLDSDSFVSEYNTYAQCAIATGVFSWIPIPQNSLIATPLMPRKHHRNATNLELISAVTDAVRHPPCIVKVAESYIRDVLKNQKFVGFHWRYDQRDWIPIFCRKLEWKMKCEPIKQATASHLAQVIANDLEKELYIMTKETPIFISSPLSLANFVDEIYKNISKINKNFIKPTESVEMYLTKRHQECWNTNGWLIPEGIISLCEMEVMIRSEWFFYSFRSSWSRNIRPFRFSVDENGKISKRYEKNILELI